MNKLELTMHEDDVWLLFLAAFRYATGRRTYMPDTIPKLILANKDKLTAWQRKQLADEVHKYKEDYGDLGDKCDEFTWESFAVEIVKEVK